MTEARRVLRVFPDWGHRWPLWESFTGKYAVEPADYDLSTELTEAMRQWYSFWEKHFDPLDGWDSIENQKLSRAQGDVMVAKLRLEVDSYADVADERSE